MLREEQDNMTEQEIWNCEKPVADLLDIAVPAWIEQDIAASTIASIVQGGCASGAYMPAVTYYDALRTMSEHGDDVLQFLQDYLGELPAPRSDESWSGMACHYLSYAVELWAGDVMLQLEEHDVEESDDDTAE
jgi:hypothetical protein